MLRTLCSKGQTYDEGTRDLIEKSYVKELDARWNRILEKKSSSC